MTRGAGSVVAMKALAVVLLLALAACSSGSGRAAPDPTIATTAPTTPATGIKTDCTSADLTGPTLPMPEPQPVDAPLALGGKEGARLEPAPNASPAVSAEQAWQRLTALNPQRARSGELLLGTFSASIPFGPNGPQKLHLLAWVLRVHHLAYPYPIDKNPIGAPAATIPFACQFVDGYLVVDATTGNPVVNNYLPLPADA